MQNPFFVGGPVPAEYFVGRAYELNVAFDQILSRGHLAIYGSDGMGKSSFLRYLASPKTWEDRRHPATAAIIIYIDCMGINPFTPSAFLREILSLLKDESADDAAMQSEIDEILKDATIEKGDLRRVLKKIGQRNKFLVLLVDEYDNALRPNDKYTEAEMLTFLAEFRNLAVHTDEGRYLSTIVTSFRRLNELGPKLTPGGSPWYNHYLFLPFKPFGDTETATLLNRMPAEWTLTAELREGIQEISNGHPALLQNACSLLYANLRAGQPRAVNIENFARDFIAATEHFFRDAWRFSTEVEQMLLMLIALSGLEGRLNKKRQYDLNSVDSIFSQMDRELRDLEERGIIRHTKKQGKAVYSFASSIMEWWVIKEIENSKDEAELQQRQKVFFNLVSRKQVEQIKNVMQLVWQHKDAVESVVGWVGKLVGAFAKGVNVG